MYLEPLVDLLLLRIFYCPMFTRGNTNELMHDQMNEFIIPFCPQICFDAYIYVYTFRPFRLVRKKSVFLHALLYLTYQNETVRLKKVHGDRTSESTVKCLTWEPSEKLKWDVSTFL